MEDYLFDDKLPSVTMVDYNSIGTEITIKLLELKNQIKIIHWQTTDYSEHKPLDKLFNILGVHIDKWVETFMGKYGRIVLSKKGEMLTLKNKKPGVDSTISYLADSIKALRNLRDAFFSKSEDSDISSILDDIFADLNRTRYLLSLK
jgi:hypothetical protein|tara:strand:+ start:1507 stop:1947 length:441 start_codon:yes stop_codon:yes gene_type:complete